MNLKHVIERRFESTTQSYDWRDSALYALGLGFGSDPLDEDELPYVYEGRAQCAVASQCMVLGWPEFWHADPATGIDWVNIVHGEERFELHRPLPLAATVRATHRLRSVVDKGVGHGALIHFDTEIANAQTGEAIASLQATQFLRGDGGCGSHGVAPPVLPPLHPGDTPSAAIEYRTAPQAALLYRLVSRDYMPIHADPVVARRAGFERPISHGARLRSMFVRFASPAYPGDTIRVEMFDQGAKIRFRALAVERGVTVLDRGECVLAGH